MNINLKARIVAAIAQFKATADIRYYLNGVYVEPCDEGGVLIVATNGHAMGIWHDPSGVVERPIILACSAKLIAACSGGKNDRRLIDKFGRLTVVDDKTGAEIHIQPVEKKSSIVEIEPYEVPGDFPNWRNVVPVLDGQCVQLFNVFQPSYLHLANQAAHIGCGLKFKGATIRQEKKDKAIVIQFADINAAGFMSIVMPVRDGEVNKNPAWLKPKKPTAEIPKQPSDAVPPEVQQVEKSEEVTA